MPTELVPHETNVIAYIVRQRYGFRPTAEFIAAAIPATGTSVEQGRARGWFAGGVPASIEADVALFLTGNSLPADVPDQDWCGYNTAVSAAYERWRAAAAP